MIALVNYRMAYEKKRGNWIGRGRETGADKQSHNSSGWPLLDSELQSSQTNTEMSNRKRPERNFHILFSMFLLVNSNINFYSRPSAWAAMHFS